MNGQSDNEQFSRLIVALEPWLDQVVVIGGWAHRLYWLHPSAQRIDHLPLTTLDTDIAIPAPLKVVDRDVRERLIAHGFEEERLGDDQPPATHYRLADAKTGFYAEFLTPLFGPEHGRDGKLKATRRIVAWFLNSFATSKSSCSLLGPLLSVTQTDFHSTIESKHA